jgi:cytochrome P450
MAGSDSSASAIRLIMLYIITCPRIEAALLAEISAASISTPIKDSEARKLPYLQAVIKEGLRVYPPASILGYREVPSGGETINGFFVPEDTMLGYNFFGMTRDPNLWGEDANLFRPERWLTGSEEQLRRMAANTELVFSYGKWQCLGKNLAMMELNKVFVEVSEFIQVPSNIGQYICIYIYILD